MDIRIKHTDKSGHQWFEPGQLYTALQANNYINWMEKRYGEVPYSLEIDGRLIRERKDSNKKSIIYA